MSRQNYVEHVLQELGTEVGLEALAFDDDDRLSLTFDTIAVTFTYAAEPTELLLLYVDLGAMPQPDQKATHYLLRAGLTTWASSAMTIGLNEDGTKAIGFNAIAVGTLDLATLKTILVQLLDAARPIRDHLAGRQNHSDDATPAVTDTMGLRQDGCIKV